MKLKIKILFVIFLCLYLLSTQAYCQTLYDKWKKEADERFSVWKKEADEAYKKWKGIKPKKESDNKTSSIEVFWISPRQDSLTVRKQNYPIQACILSKTSIRNIQVIHNGNDKGKERSQSRVPACKGTPFKTVLKLKEGLNNIVLDIENEKGRKREVRTVYYSEKNKNVWQWSLAMLLTKIAHLKTP